MTEPRVPDPLTLLGSGSVPVPDPTRLTTYAVKEATEQWRRDLEAESQRGRRDLDALRTIIETRLDAMDRATVLRLEATEKFPVLVDREIEHLGGLVDERFRSVAQQFVERDVRTDRETRDSKIALDAALAAQKEAAVAQNQANREAIAKSEAATAETIRTNRNTFQAVTDGLTKAIDELKQRTTVIESTRVGAVAQQAEVREVAAGTRSSQTVMMQAVAIVVAVLLASIPIAIAIYSHK